MLVKREDGSDESLVVVHVSRYVIRITFLSQAIRKYRITKDKYEAPAFKLHVIIAVRRTQTSLDQLLIFDVKLEPFSLRLLA